MSDTVVIERQSTAVVVQTVRAAVEVSTPGPQGPVNTLAVGTVTTLNPGDPASANIVGAAPNQTLNLSIPGSPVPSALSPVMDSAAAVGVSLSYARADHVHPTDTTRAKTDGSNATGTWGISISGNAATVTNGVYSTGSYVNPAWIVSLPWSKITTTPTTRDGYGITDVPKTDGTGATGTWGIGISGNAATATNSTQLGGVAAASYAKLATAQQFTAPQRASNYTANTGSLDCAQQNNFKVTPAAGITLTPSNMSADQSGYILLINGSNYSIAKAASVKCSSSLLATISSTGTYLLSYYTDGTSMYITGSSALA